MKKLITKALKAAHGYTLWDFACLKLCLLSLGIALGAFFAAFFMNWIFVICGIFILTWLWLFYRTFMR